MEAFFSNGLQPRPRLKDDFTQLLTLAKRTRPDHSDRVGNNQLFHSVVVKLEFFHGLESVREAKHLRVLANPELLRCSFYMRRKSEIGHCRSQQTEPPGVLGVLV